MAVDRAANSCMLSARVDGVEMEMSCILLGTAISPRPVDNISAWNPLAAA
jgi:hypothetical protein